HRCGERERASVAASCVVISGRALARTRKPGLAAASASGSRLGAKAGMTAALRPRRLEFERQRCNQRPAAQARLQTAGIDAEPSDGRRGGIASEDEAVLLAQIRVVVAQVEAQHVVLEAGADPPMRIGRQRRALRRGAETLMPELGTQRPGDLVLVRQL